MGNSAVTAAYMGSDKIFPIPGPYGNYDIAVAYNVTGSPTTILSQEAMGIEWMEIDGVRYTTPVTEFSFPTGVNTVYYKVDGNHGLLCTGLESVTAVTANTSLYTSEFEGCSNLSHLELWENVVQLADNNFRGCTSLTAITLPQNLERIGWGVFYQCYNIVSSVIIPDSVLSIGRYAFYICSGVTSLTIGSGVTTIDADAFWRCRGISNYVTIPNSVTSIGDRAFYQCENITGLTIGDGVTTIPTHAFLGCKKISTLVLGTGLTAIGQAAFQNTLELTSIYLNTTNTVTVAASAFGYSGPVQPLTGTLYYHSGTDITDFQTALPNWTFTTF